MNNPYPLLSRAAEYTAAHDRQDADRKATDNGIEGAREELAFLQGAVAVRGRSIVRDRLEYLVGWIAMKERAALEQEQPHA